MLLTGTYYRQLDDKLRLAIPKPLREALDATEPCILYLAPGTDGSLAVYPKESFERLAARLEERAPTGRDVRAFSRLFYAQVQRVEVDNHGRIRLPIELAQQAGLRKEIVLLGVREHLEIWDRGHWDGYLEETQPNYDVLAESALSSNGAWPTARKDADPARQGDVRSDATARSVPPR